MKENKYATFKYTKTDHSGYFLACQSGVNPGQNSSRCFALEMSVTIGPDELKTLIIRWDNALILPTFLIKI